MIVFFIFVAPTIGSIDWDAQTNIVTKTLATLLKMGG